MMRAPRRVQFRTSEFGGTHGGRSACGAKRTFVETLTPARCQEETLAAQASGILDLSSCRRGCRAADGNRTVRDERDAGGVEGVVRSRAGRGNCFGER